MKRLIYLSVILPLLIASCEVQPEAAFYVDTVTPEVGQEVFFTNDSYNAESFEWDFGDNTFSDSPNPVHAYKGSGTYQVKLTAISSTGSSDEAFQTISVQVPTLLEIEVLEYYDEYPVEDASVILYPTLDDWDAQRNMITEGFTDKEGIVVFSGLGNFVYYLDVWQEEHNNYALRDEDPLFITTPMVRPNRITRFIAYVDYIQGTKGSGERDRKMVIRKLVPRDFSEKEQAIIEYQNRK